MKLKKVILGTVAILALSACNQPEKQEEAPREYDVISMEKQSAVLQTVYPTTVRGTQDVEIRPRIDGFINAIYVDEGSVVRKGQSLFKIDSPRAEQDITTARANVATAKLNVDRLRPLAEKGIISEVQLATAEESYRAATAMLRSAQETVKWSNVLSPVDGVVGTISFRQGSLVSSANALTTVANTKDVYAYFSLNEKELMALLNRIEGKTQAEKIKNLPEISLVLADGTEYAEKGKIETIAGVVNITTGSVNFRAKFPNRQGLLRSGISGRVIVPQVVDSVFVIPQESTMPLQDKILVFTVSDNTVQQKTIMAETMPDGKHYAVFGGLEEGDVIVKSGLATLRNGEKIKPRQ